MSEVINKIVETAKGEFLTLATVEQNEHGHWALRTPLHYIREQDRVFQTQLFGRNVLSDVVSEQMCELFDKTPIRTHTDSFKELLEACKPSWK